MRFPPLGWLAASLAVAGCTRPAPTTAVLRPPEVIFDRPAVESVADFEEFTGRTTAFKVVEVRARVTGHLEALRFRDGDEVDAGAPLFDLDAKPFLAELERARAAVKQTQARATRLGRDDARAQDLRSRGAVSQEDAERIAGEFDEARAAVDVAKAQEKVAQQNVDYSHIASPIKGRIGKRAIDPGNLVKADDTLLATIVATDTVYADFDVDDRTVLRLARLEHLGLIPPIRSGKVRVRVGLPDEDGFSKDGLLTFDDNKLNPNTGTKGLRAEVANADRLIEPGLFVRVRLPIGEPKPAVMVPEAALGTDQGLRFVYVVDADDKIEYRRVKPGMQVDRPRAGGGTEQFRVVEPVPEVKGSGVTAADRIVVEGVQRVKYGAKVSPKARPAAEAPKPAGGPAPKTPGAPAGAG